MIFQNEWLDRETKLINNEMNKPIRINSISFKKMLFTIFFLLVLLSKMYADDNCETRFFSIQCPHCNMSHEITIITDVDIETTYIEKGIFGDTWSCDNDNCRYDNYDGVNSCGICGSDRY